MREEQREKKGQKALTHVEIWLTLVIWFHCHYKILVTVGMGFSHKDVQSLFLSFYFLTCSSAFYQRMLQNVKYWDFALELLNQQNLKPN